MDKRKNIIGLGIATSIILLIAGVGYYVFANVSNALNYCYRIVGFKVKNISSKSIDFALNLAFYNPSELSANIESYDLQVFVNDIKLANIRQNVAKTIKPNNITYVDIPVSIVPSEMGDNLFLKALGVISKYTSDRSGVVITISGNYTVKVGFIRFSNRPISISMSLKEIEEPSTNSDICEGFEIKNKE